MSGLRMICKLYGGMKITQNGKTVNYVWDYAGDEPDYSQQERRMRDGEPYSESIGHVDFGGFYLTHAIWHNSYGSSQPETGVRSHAGNLKDFRLIQHNSRDWPLVTIVALAALAKGWDAYRIGKLLEWWDARRRKRAMSVLTACQQS